MAIKKSKTHSDKSLSVLEHITGKKLTIGNVLWSIREADGITQTNFAKQLQISRQYLCDLEHGRRGISPKMAAAFAIQLGYSQAQFVRLAIQDELNRAGLHFDIQINDAA